MPQPTYTVPKEGSLSLLALGHRGLDAWREVRGTEWLEERKASRPAPIDGPRAQKKPSPDELAGLSVAVVSGLPRSGTSMAMQMLHAGGLGAFTDHVRAPDESNPRGYFEHERVKALHRDALWLPDADGLAVKVVAPLLSYLPQGPAYRIVFLERDVDQILDSQARMLSADGLSAQPDDRLRPAYEGFVQAAFAWAESAPNVRLLRLRHRDALDAPQAAAERIAAFFGEAGIELDPDAMAAAIDPTLHRQHGRPLSS